MSLLQRSQLRFVARAPWSAATALLGVSLGVASVVAVHLISARVAASLDETTPPHLEGLAYVLDRDGSDAEDYFELRRRWRGSPRSRVRALVPLVDGRAAAGGRNVRVLGVDWLAMPPPVDGAGPLPVDVSEPVLLGEAVVADTSLGVAPGGLLRVGGRDFGVAAVRDFGPGDTVLADIAAAQAMLGGDPERVDRVGVAVTDPWRDWRRLADGLMPGIAAGLPDPATRAPSGLAPELLGDAGWRAVSASSQRPSAEFAGAVLFNLGALGLLALLVAWFLIYQVAVIWLRRQHLLLDRLHVLGVSTARLRRSFVTVFLVLGALATVLGGALGIWLAGALTGLSASGVSLAADVPALTAWVAGKALVSGLGVCLAGALLAFARTRDDGPAGGGRWPWWAAGVLAAVAAAGIVVDASGVAGGFLAIFAMSMLGVLLVRPMLAGLRRAAVGAPGPVWARLAVRDVAFYPRMVGVAIAALSLAVATAMGVALMVDSFRGDFERMLTARLGGDVYVRAAADDIAMLRPWLARQDGVTDVDVSGRDRIRVDGLPAELGYADFDAAESGRYGFPRALAGGEALLSERLARDLRVDPGDTVRVDGAPVTLAGVFPGFGDPMGRLLVDVSTLDRLGVAPRFDRMTITLAPGVDPETLGQVLSERASGVRVESRRAVRTLALTVFDRTFAITQALTMLALVVAVVGTYNALTALRLHQQATTALLRAEGVTAREARRISLARAVTVGGVAMALAAPLGVAMAWTLCTVINPRSFGWSVALHVPASGWWPPLLLGILAAVLAGVLPAPKERGIVHEGV